MKEKQIEKSIMEYLQSIGAYVVKIHSGTVKVLKNFGEKSFGRFNKTATNYMQLAPKGTPDLVAIIPKLKPINENSAQLHGIPVFIEVKRDQKEVDKWLRIAERYESEGTAPQSYHREVMQYKQMEKATQAGALCLLVCSIQGLEDDLKANNLIF